jgi:hypothetical protein
MSFLPKFLCFVFLFIKNFYNTPFTGEEHVVQIIPISVLSYCVILPTAVCIPSSILTAHRLTRARGANNMPGDGKLEEQQRRVVKVVVAVFRLVTSFFVYVSHSVVTG